MATERVELPISGKVTQVTCKIGDKVKEGDVICILESMKMENPILAPVAGTVKEVKITPGQQGDPGDLVAVIEY